MRIAKSGRVISSVEDWFTIAPPKKGGAQWVAGRSARELAQAWFPCAGEPVVPPELAALLTGAPNLGTVTLQDGEPEFLVRFDDLQGGMRNCDLMIMGESTVGSVAISIEAKADESFGRSVAGERRAARHRASNLPERMKTLAKALFGVEDLQPIGDIRYQLIHGTAAALAVARQRRANIAVVVIHEFVTDATRDRKHETNTRALDRFVELLTKGEVVSVGSGRLVGPFRVPGNKHVAGDIPLYLGKAKRYLRKAAS